MTAYRDITRSVHKCQVCGALYYPDNGDVCECPDDDSEYTGIDQDAVIPTLQPE